MALLSHFRYVAQYLFYDMSCADKSPYFVR